MIKNSLVVGSGNWGTTMAKILAEAGREVTLWVLEEKVATDIQENKMNSIFLPGVKLPDNISVKTDYENFEKFELIILVIPVNSTRQFLKKIQTSITSKHKVLCLSKGIELNTGRRVSQIIQETLPGFANIAVLSGPNIANEIAIGKPALSTVSSQNIEISKQIQEYCSSHRFRIYTNPDLIGVEICGALKNIIAIGAGICHQLNLGDNAIAALITRGIAEIARYGQRFGANPTTFMGMAGVGDLSVTCMSPHSRNNRMGRYLAQGLNLDEARDQMKMVSEGVPTCKIVYSLSKKHDIYMPITEAIYKVLFENLPAHDAVDLLMQSDLKDELH